MPEVGKPGKTPCHQERQSPSKGLWITVVPQGLHKEYSSVSCSLWFEKGMLASSAESLCAFI